MHDKSNVFKKAVVGINCKNSQGLCKHTVLCWYEANVAVNDSFINQINIMLALKADWKGCQGDRDAAS